MAATQSFACAVAVDGTLTCFGPGAPPAPPGTFGSIDGGRGHMCALTVPDGLLVCFGDDLYDQTDSPNGAFAGVSAGGDASCALASDGALRCFGSSSAGQLDGPTGSWKAVSVGGDFACALDAAGFARCWGDGIWGATTIPTP